MPGPFSFRDRHRIRHAREFLDLKRTGKKAFSRMTIMNWRRSPDRNDSRPRRTSPRVLIVGLVLSKKNLGNKAIDRHRAGRLLREAFRRTRPEFVQPVDIVLIPRRPLRNSRQPEVDQELRQLLNQAGILKCGS